MALRLDGTQESQVEAAIADGIGAWGRIDILVNNAGVTPGLGLPFTRQVEADWDTVFGVNLKSVFFACKHIAPHFMERRSGTIVNISSIAGPLSSLTMPSYSVVKMGVITLTKIVAKELAPHNVKRTRSAPASCIPTCGRGSARRCDRRTRRTPASPRGRCSRTGWRSGSR
ncbi:MAG: hypothetical protein A2Z31_03675 [candidate division NC10 bacterium RBG_16_65_8]|nr:MAG: hypothetical protein A2Z31_03675 [candidate division NC10 bacterium RBG_16_65_8]